MKSIIKKIKDYIPFLKHKEKQVSEYTDLAPIDNITNGDEYLNALDWAINSGKVRNIALAGPYGAGKSSIIETYLKKHPLLKKKCLRISMATFVENAINEDGTLKKVDIGKDEIEIGILKQLFYKVNHKKIPQSRYRKLHKIGWKHIWGYLIGLVIIFSLMEYIFGRKTFNAFLDKIIIAGESVKLSPLQSLTLFGILTLGILAVMAIMYRSIISHYKVKEIKLPVDATVKSEDDSKETVFNKNMDEIIYFFEETNYRLVFFEDLDRLENSSIFVHLRELNTLLNNYEAIKEPIIFVYAVKDNIFSETDRTKFFEFIVPVIPVINSTNSSEIFFEKLEHSKEMGIMHDISQGFVLDVSPYISDMRILQNIYNEFIVYKKTLRMGQELALLDEPMMALIIFKNLYPCDFADIQTEQGIIKKAFIGKQSYLRIKQTAIQDEIDRRTQTIKRIPFEQFGKIREIKSVFLCEITNWQGTAYHFTIDNGSRINAREFLDNNYDTSNWENKKRCTGSYYNWEGSGGYSFSCNNFQEIYTEYLEREKSIRLIDNKSIVEEQKKIEHLKLQKNNISGWSLKKMIEEFGIEEVLPEEVKKNKLLVFLLRRGYIDEDYANYINYFKGNSITKDDMNFILAVKNMEQKSFDYKLTKTPMVIQRLQVYEFRQKAIYNFDLLECLLSCDDEKEKLDTFINQLSDGDEQSWKFIDESIGRTKQPERYIKLLALAWHGMWQSISNNAILTYERKVYYLTMLISNSDTEVLVAMNANHEMSSFIEQNEDILQRLVSVDSYKVIATIENLHVMFNKVFIENVPERVLDYIFDNNYYELNPFMIQQVVVYKNSVLVPDLKTKNYTTVINMCYAPLIKYIRENLSHYIERVILIEEQSFDNEELVVDLLERSIDDIEQCIRIIEHEQLSVKDITVCCGNLLSEKKEAVKYIWNTLLKESKITPTWKNIISYWLEFKFTHSLLDYIETHIEDLICADSQCIGCDFFQEFIGTEISDNAFEVLLPYINVKSADIEINSVKETKVLLMIGCRYLEFTVKRYTEIKELFPGQGVEFILTNQEEYLALIHEIPMDSNLLEQLLLSNRLETKTAQSLLDNYGTKYMTDSIATNLQNMGISISLDIFKVAWNHLDESSKQKLLLGHLNLLDADAMNFCFSDLKNGYVDFIDRSKQHAVEVVDTPENRKLAERLKEIDYITSYQVKEKRGFDTVIGTDKVRTVIICRVKALKR